MAKKPRAKKPARKANGGAIEDENLIAIPEEPEQDTGDDTVTINAETGAVTIEHGDGS